MNNAIEQMLHVYGINNAADKKNALKEVVQEIVLCGLSRDGFFEKAAFYGGTALRIFYGLDRFSEDLDFSLTLPDNSFDFDLYLPMLEKELTAWGLNLKVEPHEKSVDSDIRSAFVKGNTREHLLLFFPSENLKDTVAASDIIKIKFEVDTTPPMFASFEHKYRLLPMPYDVLMYDAPSLFAGKIHAVAKAFHAEAYALNMAGGSGVNVNALYQMGSQKAEAPAVNGWKCPNCGAYLLPHRACKACGFYKGREVVKVGEANK